MKKDTEGGRLYCRDCAYRADRKLIDKSATVDDGGTEMHGSGKEALGNTDKFCSIGFKVNPKSFEATANAISAGSIVCGKNPWKSAAMVGR